ncbi:FlgO family outer membrane protein [Catenovulum sp. SX2]|uniref:FlgO family outer membrane protein n=1 Tax=Catenovulum sp. SX2 TaxID=3398614 RepID=UPI003F86F4BF
MTNLREHFMAWHNSLNLTLVAASVLLVSGCAYKSTHSYIVPEKMPQEVPQYYQPSVSQLSIKAYAFMLADELLLNVRPESLYGNVAVTHFVEQANRQIIDGQGHPLKALGGQLEESFIYELQKRGYSVVDFKLTGDIQVGQQADKIWSRDINKLNSHVDVRYLLSGTLSMHQNGAVVNVRMMDSSSKQVIASAQGFVPHNVFYSSQEIMTQDGMLIHKGERARVPQANGVQYD